MAASQRSPQQRPTISFATPASAGSGQLESLKR